MKFLSRLFRRQSDAPLVPVGEASGIVHLSTAEAIRAAVKAGREKSGDDTPAVLPWNGEAIREYTVVLGQVGTGKQWEPSPEFRAHLDKVLAEAVEENPTRWTATDEDAAEIEQDDEDLPEGPFGIDGRSYRDLIMCFEDETGLQWGFAEIKAFLDEHRHIAAGLIEWGSSDTVVKDQIYVELPIYLTGEKRPHIPHGTPHDEIMRIFDEHKAVMQAAGIAKGFKEATDV